MTTPAAPRGAERVLETIEYLCGCTATGIAPLPKGCPEHWNHPPIGWEPVMGPDGPESVWREGREQMIEKKP